MEVQRSGRIAVGYLSYFKGSSAVQEESLDNSIELDNLDAFFNVVLRDSLIAFDRVEILGTASIEGTYYNNDILARARAYSLKRFLDDRYNLSSYAQVELKWIPEDWEGLEACVRNTPLTQLPQREAILRIITGVSLFDGRELQLMKLDAGHPYRYMERHLFPLQRRATITLIYDLKKAVEYRLGHEVAAIEVERAIANTLLPAEEASAFMADTAITARAIDIKKFVAPATPAAVSDSLPTREPSFQTVLETTLSKLSEVKEEAVVEIATVPAKPTIEPQPQATPVLRPKAPKRILPRFTPTITLSTNLLSWGGIIPEAAMRTPMPNLWVEWIVSRRFSLAVSALYGNLSVKTREYATWHATAYTLEPRIRLVSVGNYGGLYAGVYGRLGDYNFKAAEIGVLPSQTGTYYEGGLSVGYTWPFARRWIIEVGGAGGYRRVQDQTYTPEEKGNYFDYQTTVGKVALTDLFVRIGYRFGTTKKQAL
ncbi:MAG: DUF3575 domain-containing protein [Prevotellaceae bacterium]|nr:DUF3575 domain-containing protein [Prevotellaceae bacterium]